MKTHLKTVKRCVLGFLLGLYVITWVWGIPAVHTSIAVDVIKHYKSYFQHKPETPEIRAMYPRLRFTSSFAVLPLVTVTHLEQEVGPRVGWGGYVVNLWYFTGRRTVWVIREWVT